MLLNIKEIGILEAFSSDYSRKIYGRDIAKKLKLNQKTVSNMLAKLEKEDVLKFSQEGRNKYYFLNKFNPDIKEIIKIIEISRKIKFLKKNAKLRGLFDNLEKNSEGVVCIFGSYARGENTKNSDLDILSLGRTPEIENLEKSYNLKINVISSSKAKFDKNENIIKEVIKNHIILKGLEEFVDLT
jgi:predicted nucleotidyltransferase